MPILYFSPYYLNINHKNECNLMYTSLYSKHAASFLRFIKLTSPNLSYPMPLGAILLYAVVIVTGAPTEALGKSIVCNVSHVTSCDFTLPVYVNLCTVSKLLSQIELWLGSLGFTLIFGGILVRTWRIHYIFNYIVVGKINQKPPKDWILILATGVFLLIDLIVLTIFTGVPQIRFLAFRTKLVSELANKVCVYICSVLSCSLVSIVIM